MGRCMSRARKRSGLGNQYPPRMIREKAAHAGEFRAAVSEGAPSADLSCAVDAPIMNVADIKNYKY